MNWLIIFLSMQFFVANSISENIDTCLNANLCERYNLSERVFIGQLVETQHDREWTIYKFKAQETFKGKISQQVIIYAYRGTVLCLDGPYLQDQKTYLVLATKIKNGRYIAFWDRGKLIKEVSQAQAEIEILRSNKKKLKLSSSFCQEMKIL